MMKGIYFVFYVTATCVLSKKLYFWIRRGITGWFTKRGQIMDILIYFCIWQIANMFPILLNQTCGVCLHVTTHIVYSNVSF